MMFVLLHFLIFLFFSILLPIIMRLVVSSTMNISHVYINNTKHNISTTGQDAVTFAFLYGTIPTAPTVMMFASKYGIGEDTVRILFVHRIHE